MDVEEVKEVQAKGMENILNKIIAAIFPNLGENGHPGTGGF
jgi:hypothetical protein